jgi:hypothetical protein
MRRSDRLVAILLPVAIGMQRRTATILLLAGALVLALAVALARGRGDDPAPPGPSPRPDVPAPSPAPVPPRPVDRGSQDPASLPADAPRVVLELETKERYLPPSPARARAVRGDGHEYAVRLLAGAGAGFDANVRAAGLALVGIEHERGLVLRQVVLPPDDTAVVELGAALLVHGRVTGSDGRALVGATVWLGEHDVDGNRVEAVTVDDGAYELTALAGTGVPFVVRAPGHAASWRPLVVGNPAPRADAALERGCELTVQLAGSAVAMEHARVYVVPRGAVDTALAQWPFFLQALGDGYPLDASGRAVIGELPARGDVGIVVGHPRAPRAAPQELMLKGDRVAATLAFAVAPARVSGSVVDEQGAPLPGVAVFGRAGGGPLAPGTSQRLLPPHLDERGVFAGRTGDDGAFTIGVPAAPGAIVSLRAAGRAGRDVPVAAVAVDVPLVLPAWNGGDAELRVRPPRADGAWSAETAIGGGVRAALAAGETWRVALPHAGRFHVVLTTWVGTEQRGRERHADVHATGAVELSAPPLR